MLENHFMESSIENLFSLKKPFGRASARFCRELAQGALPNQAIDVVTTIITRVAGE